MNKTKGFRKAWKKRREQLIKDFPIINVVPENEEILKDLCNIFYRAGVKDSKKFEKNKKRTIPDLDQDELELKLARASALNKTYSQLVAGIGEELKALASKQQVIEMNFKKITFGNNEQKDSP